LGSIALENKELEQMIGKLNKLDVLTNDELQTIYECKIKYSSKSVDDKDYKQ